MEDEARLFIDVDSSAEEVLSGSNITYTVTVTNEGGVASSALAVVDELPSETVFVSCESTGGGVCGGSGNVRSVSFNSLLPEATAVITLVAAVSCPVPDATEISNTAEIHPLTPDPDADETDNETIFVTVRNPPPPSQASQLVRLRSGRRITRWLTSPSTTASRTTAAL